MNYSFRFLVAEASFPARIIIRNQLMQLGQHVDIVPSIEDTLMQITSKSYDMLLIDSYLYYSQGDYDWTALALFLNPPQSLLSQNLGGSMTLWHPK